MYSAVYEYKKKKKSCYIFRLALCQTEKDCGKYPQTLQYTDDSVFSKRCKTLGSAVYTVYTDDLVIDTLCIRIRKMFYSLASEKLYYTVLEKTAFFSIFFKVF